MLEVLAGGPMTAQQLADKLHLSRSGAQWHLNALMEQKPRLAHIAGFAPNPKRQRSAPLYGLGDKKDAKCVKTRAPKGRITVADRHAQILEMLAEKPRTAAEVVDEMLLQRARIYIFDLHAAGKVRIARWRAARAGGYPSPVYAVGSAPDAPRPKPQTGSESSARYWKKLKADPHRHGHHLQRNRMRKKPQTWLSALMG
jgi:hypothetical protein